jgi:hypothetical protein
MKKRPPRRPNRPRDKSIPARARSVNMAPRTLQGEIEKGRGPKVTYTSPRGRIIEDEPWEEWLRERRDNPPAEVTDTPSPNPKARRGVHTPNLDNLDTA